MSCKIFEVGFGRTGSKSLTAAMQILGYDAKHGFGGPGAQRYAYECFLWGKLPTRWIKRHDFLANWPSLCYDVLDREYPGSKFILTTREETSWLRSIEQHVRRTRSPVLQARKGTPGVAMLMRLAMAGQVRFDAQHFLHRYLAHNETVRQYFADRPQDFLEFNVVNGDGWAKLCRFLGKRKPRCKFPWVRDFPEAKQLGIKT